MKVKGTEFVVYGWLLSVIVWKVCWSQPSLSSFISSCNQNSCKDPHVHLYYQIPASALSVCISIHYPAEWIQEERRFIFWVSVMEQDWSSQENRLISKTFNIHFFLTLCCVHNWFTAELFIHPKVTNWTCSLSASRCCCRRFTKPAGRLVEAATQKTLQDDTRLYFSCVCGRDTNTHTRAPECVWFRIPIETSETHTSTSRSLFVSHRRGNETHCHIKYSNRCSQTDTRVQVQTIIFWGKKMIKLTSLLSWN